MAQGFTKGIPVDTDSTMSANSAFLVPSQSAVRAYVGSFAGAANNSAALGGIPAASYALKADLGPVLDVANAAFDKANSANLLAYAALPNTSGVSFGGNLTIAGNLIVTDAISNVDSIQFNTSSGVTVVANGQLAWNTDESTLDLMVDGQGNGTVLQIGQEIYYRVKNQTGTTIPDGTVVMSAGTLGSSGRILVRPAVANGAFPSKYVMGVTTQPITDGADGFVTSFGKVRKIDTSMFSEGDILYADPATPGALSNTMPTAPNTKTTVAIVVHKDATNGILFVRPTYGSKLNEDELVELSSLTNNDMLVYVSANGRFENRSQTTLIPYDIAVGAYNKANAANSLAFNTGVGANAFAAATIAGANTAVGAGANAFTSTTVAGANTAVGAGANAFTSATIAGANTAVGTGANNYLLAVIAGANTAVGTGANNYQIAIQNGANTAVGAGANAFTSSTVAGANTAVGAGANAFAAVTIAGANTAVGAGANAYASTVGTGANAFTSATVAGANTAVGAGANSYAAAASAGANAYMIAVQNGSNTAVGTGANAFTSTTIAGANTAVGAGANAYAATVGTGANAFTSTTIAGANTAVGAGSNAFTSTTIAGANTAVGAGANAFAAATVSGANTIAIAAFTKANTGTTIAIDTVDATRYIVFANTTSGTLVTANVDTGLTFNPSSNTLAVNGPFTAVSKSFVIEHPTKDGMLLRYGSLEGPENGVYVRGKLDGQSVIELPEYWWNLVDQDTITVNITPYGRAQDLWVQSVSAYAINLNQPAECFFTVFAERKDVEKLVVEY